MADVAELQVPATQPAYIAFDACVIEADKQSCSRVIANNVTSRRTCAGASGGSAPRARAAGYM